MPTTETTLQCWERLCRELTHPAVELTVEEFALLLATYKRLLADGHRFELSIYEPPTGFRLLVVDWMPPYLGWDDAIEMIFDGGVVAEGDLAYWSLQPTEIKAVALTDLSTASQLLTPLAFRRLSLAVGLGPDEMAYTEDGRTV